MTLDELRESYDWKEAFAYADGQNGAGGSASPTPVEGFKGKTGPVKITDVVEIIAYEDGENDGAEWIGVFKTKHGHFLFLAAVCDFTGWDCQASGTSWVANSLAKLVQFGLTDDARSRLRKQLKAHGVKA